MAETSNGSDVRNGESTIVWPDGAKYAGQWANGKFNGKGKLIHADGDTYDGEFVSDKAHGYGVYSHVEGSTYKGLWVEDQQHGDGAEFWPDGQQFSGQYRNGAKHGLGQFIWADGGIYDGQFANNVFQGRGLYTWSDGRKYKGAWAENRMHGRGTFCWPDGRSYEGQYSKDQKDGIGTLSWPDGRRYEGQWRGGKHHGTGIFTDADGVARSGEWERGKVVRWTEDDDEKLASPNGADDAGGQDVEGGHDAPNGVEQSSAVVPGVSSTVSPVHEFWVATGVLTGGVLLVAAARNPEFARRLVRECSERIASEVAIVSEHLRCAALALQEKPLIANIVASTHRMSSAFLGLFQHPAFRRILSENAERFKTSFDITAERVTSLTAASWQHVGFRSRDCWDWVKSTANATSEHLTTFIGTLWAHPARPFSN